MSVQPGAPPPYAEASKAAYPPPPNSSYPPPPNAAYPGQPAQYSYPPGGHAAYGQQSQTTVVVAQPTVALIQGFRELPVRTRCPHCNADIMTATHYETGTFSWIVCLILCLVGCNLGCCLIPFCCDGCKDVTHTCPNCRQHVARWNRM